MAKITKAMREAYREAIKKIEQDANEQIKKIEQRRNEILVNQAIKELFQDDPVQLNDIEFTALLNYLTWEGVTLSNNWANDPEPEFVELAKSAIFSLGGEFLGYSEEIYKSVESNGVIRKGNSIYIAIVPRVKADKNKKINYSFISNERAARIVSEVKKIKGKFLQLRMFSVNKYFLEDMTIIAADEGIIWNFSDKKRMEGERPYLPVNKLSVRTLQRAAYLCYTGEESRTFTLCGWMELTVLHAADQKIKMGYQRAGGNCLLKALRTELFKNALCEKREEHINRVLANWESQTPEEGFNLDLLADLAKELYIKITYRDSDNNVITVSDGKAHRKHIELYGHNNHCFGSEIRTFPQRGERSCVFYPWLVTDKIQRALKDEATQDVITKIIAEYAASLEANYYWVCGSSLVSASGVVHRMPPHIEDYHTGGEYDKITLTWAEIYNRSPEEAPENLHSDYFSPSALVFEKYRKDNGIKPCASAYVDYWRLSQFEALAMPYVAAKASNAQYKHVDIVQSYLACEDNNENTRAADYIKRYGYATGDLMTHFDMRGVNPVEIFGFSGIVRLLSWETRTEYDAIGTLITAHLKTREWLPVALLEYLINNGDLCDVELLEGVIANSRLEKMRFVKFYGDLCEKAMKEYGRHTVGKLAERVKSTVIVTDDYEARYRLQSAQERGESVTGNQLGPSLWTIEQELDKTAKYYHVRSSILAYSAINLFEGIRCFKPEQIIRVLTDGIIYQGDTPGNLNTGYLRGQWREKPPGHWHNYPSPAFSRKGLALDCETFAPNSMRESLDRIARLNINLSDYAGHRVIYSYGFGGSGKTFAAVAAAVSIYGASNVVIAVPSHDMKENHTRDYCELYPGLTINTWQKIIGYGYNGMSTWTPLNTRVSQARRKCVIIDEIFLLGDWETKISQFIDAITACGSLVICCGDPHQLPYIDAGQAVSDPDRSIKIHNGLMERAHVIEFNEDRRALCPALKELKRKIWGKSDEEQIQGVREVCPSRDKAYILNNWHPRDIVLATTKALRDEMTEALIKVHREKYPNELTPIVVSYLDKGKGPKRAKIPGTAETIQIHTGKMAYINPNENVTAPWSRAVCRTIHSFQGSTVGGLDEATNPKIWICMSKMSGFAHNSCYTMISRARHLSQLQTVDIAPAIPKRVLELAEKLKRL